MGRASRRKRQQRLIGDLPVPKDLHPPVRIERRRREGRGKVSEALIELIEPFIEPGMNLDEMRTLVAVGAIAWNFSLLEEPGPDFFDGALRSHDDETRACLAAFVIGLSARKQDLFPDDERFIANWEVSPRPGGAYHVTAASLGVE